MVKIAWLVKKGLNVGQALLVAHFEVLVDVAMGGMISITATIYLLAREAYFFASVLFLLLSETRTSSIFALGGSL